MSWAFVPDTEGLNSGSGSLAVARLAGSATSRGKHTQPRSWLRRWKKGTWLRRLSGLTLPTSTASHGAERWIASLPASLASLGAKPAECEAQPTSAGSGPRSGAWFVRYDRRSYSWKTCQRSLFGEDWETFSGRWPDAGMMRLGTCFPLTASARRTVGLGSSYSRNTYPTPTAQHYGTTQNNPDGSHYRPSNGTPSLATWAKRWPTPVVSDARSAGRRNATSPNVKPGVSLTDAVKASHSLPVPKTSTDGDDTSPTVVLSPAFVEELMALPRGWTDFTCSETEFSRWWRLSLSALSALGF